MKILFTGGGGSGSEAIWNILEGRHEVYFADADITTIDPVIPAERRFEIPMAGDNGFASCVYEICINHGIDFLVPTVDEELSALADFHQSAPFNILLPSRRFVDLMLDKFLASKEIESAGLSVPETRLISEFAGMNFPLVAKPRSGRGSRGVMVLEEEGQIDAYLILQKAKGREDFFIVQQLMVGQEYTVLVSADMDGALKAILPVKVLQKKGITIKAEIEMNKAIINYVQKFQERFHGTGIYNLQCVVDYKGGVWPFEINPRVSTTFCMALRAGYDPFVGSGMDLFLPEEPLGLRRHWKNFFVMNGAEK